MACAGCPFVRNARAEPAAGDRLPRRAMRGPRPWPVFLNSDASSANTFGQPIRSESAKPGTPFFEMRGRLCIVLYRVSSSEFNGRRAWVVGSYLLRVAGPVAARPGCLRCLLQPRARPPGLPHPEPHTVSDLAGWTRSHARRGGETRGRLG